MKRDGDDGDSGYGDGDDDDDGDGSVAMFDRLAPKIRSHGCVSVGRSRRRVGTTCMRSARKSCGKSRARGKPPGQATKDEVSLGGEKHQGDPRDEGKEGDRLRGSGWRIHRGETGTIAREKGNASERDERPAETGVWERVSCGSETGGGWRDRVREKCIDRVARVGGSEGIISGGIEHGREKRKENAFAMREREREIDSGSALATEG